MLWHSLKLSRCAHTASQCICLLAADSLTAGVQQPPRASWIMQHCVNEYHHPLLQEPAEPADPPEELAEPNYFTEPRLLMAELQKMEAANAVAAAQLQARNLCSSS